MGNIDIVIICKHFFCFESMAEFYFEVQLLNQSGSPFIKQFEKIEVCVVESFDQVITDDC
jgi:hypothetical protein